MFFSKIKPLVSQQRVLALFGLALLIVCCRMAGASAQTVTQGYGADSLLQRGMIVRLDKNDTTKVIPAKADEAEYIHGVVVNANDAPVTISSDGQKVFVATVGRYDVLVSNQSGSIKSGDYITISSLDGIGMKAGQTQSTIAGKALADFDGSSGAISTTAAKTNNGKTQNVAIGRIAVDIGVGHNPLQKSESDVPQVLRKATESIANKPVTAARAYLSIIIIMVTAVITVSVLYAGIRSSIVAIGRNPLSRKSISRGLAQVILTSMIIFISGLFGVYLLLKL
jgi:hypothetical protein